MILSKYAPLIAIVVIALMIVPQYAAATSSSSVSNTTIIDAKSVHQDQYDSLVNLADEASVTNPSTWNPTYQGIYMGASTEESLFEFNDVTSLSLASVTSKLYVASEMKLSTKDIMNGISEFTVRLPFYIDAYTVAATIYLWSIPSSHCYNITLINSSTGFVWPVFDTPSLVNYVGYQPLDITGTPSSNYSYVVDNRGYIKMVAPIYPNQMYLVFCAVAYIDNGRFRMYWSSNDNFGDGLVNTSIFRYISPTIIDPIHYHYTANAFNADPGISFDMIQGIGGSVVSVKRYYHAGDVIRFYTYCNGIHDLLGYYWLMIPFITANNTIKCDVDAYGIGGTHLFNWVGAGFVYKGFITPDVNVPINQSKSSSEYDYIKVELTLYWDQEIEFLYDARPMVQQASLSAEYGWNLTHWVSILSLGAPYIPQIYFPVYNSFILATNQPAYPHAGSIIPPVVPNNPIPFLRHVLQSPVGLAVYFTNVLMVLSAPLGVAALLFPTQYADAISVGAVIVGYAYWGILGGAGVIAWEQGWLLPNLPSLPWKDPFGWVSDLIDAIWDGLMAIGNWIKSIGEYIYNVLVWLANAIVEYGSILLGLVIIAVALLLFFFPLDYLIRILESFYLIAQGKYAQGAAKGLSTSSQMVKQGIRTGKKTTGILGKIRGK